jgi:hypothetical protein
MDCLRLNIRTGFFVEIYRGLKRVLLEIFRNTDFTQEDELILIHLYFLLSDQYKKLRLSDPEHRTNDIKKAAITMASIVAELDVLGFGRPRRCSGSGGVEGGSRRNENAGRIDELIHPTSALLCAPRPERVR